MESKINHRSDDEIDKSLEEEKQNGDKKGESLGCVKVIKKIKENRRSNKTEYDIPENCKPLKGDLIEIKRTLYDHWAVYVGDGEVIHLCDMGDCKATIKRHLLKDVCGESLCRINNLESAALKRGLKPRCVDTILKDAFKMLNEKIDYHLITNNCEHFATGCRFGSRFSEQALATKRDSTRLTEIVAPLVAKSIIKTNSIINGVSKTSSNNE
jgi:hypothetical protein